MNTNITELARFARSLTIATSMFQLSQLPEDRDLTNKCGVGIEDTAEKQEDEELPSEDTDPADVATFITVVARKMTEKDTIRKSVHHRQPTEGQLVPWPENGNVPIDEFKTVGHEGEFFTDRVMHFASSLRGTSQFWFKQRSRLISMVDTLEMPTVFLTHSRVMASGPSWLASSVQTRKTAVPVAARQFPTTLPLLTGSFTTASAQRKSPCAWHCMVC